MPLMNHFHDWQQTLGGFQCGSCTAQMPQQLAQSTIPPQVVANGMQNGDINSIIQQAWMNTPQTTT